MVPGEIVLNSTVDCYCWWLHDQVWVQVKGEASEHSSTTGPCNSHLGLQIRVSRILVGNSKGLRPFLAPRHLSQYETEIVKAISQPKLSMQACRYIRYHQDT